MQLLEERKTYTIEEYLELEINSEERHEYVNGQVNLMTGGTPNHNQIALNLSGSLNFALKRQPYRVFVIDQRLWIHEKRIATYPDVMVVSGELEFQEGRKDTITNPLMIAQVLSKSTKDYDKTDKFAAYRSLPSFQEYILIDQYTMQVEHYYKTEPKKWMFLEYDGEETTLSLASLNFVISLTDLYDKVEFESALENCSK